MKGDKVVCGSLLHPERLSVVNGSLGIFAYFNINVGVVPMLNIFNSKIYNKSS